MYSHIICEEIGGVGILTLNSAKSLNSLTVPMILETSTALRGWKERDDMSCVFLQGSGERAFCAGGDVRRLYEAIVRQQRDTPGEVPDECLEFFTREYRLDYLVHRYSKPIVVWADGIVMGGGIGLAAGASHRLVTERSRFAMPEITIGLYPDVGATWFLNRMPPGYGLYLGMTGTRLDGDDCLYLGLADYRIDSASKAALLDRLTSADWQRSSTRNRELVTEIIDDLGASRQPMNSSAEAHATFVSAFHDISSVDEFKETLMRERKQDEWIDSGIKTFEAGSPSSAHIILEQLRRGRNLELEAVFRSELNLSAQCTIHPDFAEGVRALLVDKDQAPQWQPAALQDVTSSWVDSYFTPLWQDSEHPLQDLGTNETLCQK